MASRFADWLLHSVLLPKPIRAKLTSDIFDAYMYTHFRKCGRIPAEGEVPPFIQQKVAMTEAVSEQILSFVRGERLFSLNVAEGGDVVMQASSAIGHGTVVAVHPGLVYLKDEIKNIDEKRLKKYYDSFVMRYDMSVIDSTVVEEYPTPLHYGCLIKKAESRSPANVIAVPYDFPESFPADIAHSFNRWFREPGLTDIISPCTVQSLVYIACREIRHNDPITCDFVAGKWRRK